MNDLKNGGPGWLREFKAGSDNGMKFGPSGGKIANSLNGTEPDRKLRGLPDQTQAQRVFGKPVVRPLAATPTNPKSGTLVRSPWSSGK